MKINKFGAISLVVAFIFIVYLILLIVIPWLAEITVSVNTTLDTSHNMSLYPGTSSFLVSTPWILFFAPAVFGIVTIVIILKS